MSIVKPPTRLQGQAQPDEAFELARSAAIVHSIRDDVIPKFQDNPQWQDALMRDQRRLDPLFSGVSVDNAERLLRRALPETVTPDTHSQLGYRMEPLLRLIDHFRYATEDTTSPVERLPIMANVTEAYIGILQHVPEGERYTIASRVDMKLRSNFYRRTLEGLSEIRDTVSAVAGRGGSIEAAVDLVGQVPRDQAVALAVEFRGPVAMAIPGIAYGLKRAQGGLNSEVSMAELRSAGALLDDGIGRLHLGRPPQDEWELRSAVGCAAEIVGTFINRILPNPIETEGGLTQPGNPLLSRENAAETARILLSSSPETNLHPLEKAHGGYYGSMAHVHMMCYYREGVVGAINQLGVTNHQQLAEVCRGVSEFVQMRDDEFSGAIRGDISAYTGDMIPLLNPNRQFLSESLELTPYTALPLEFRGSRSAKARLEEAGVNPSLAETFSLKFDEQTVLAVAEAYPTIQRICASRRAKGQPNREDVEGFARIMHNARERAGDDAQKLFDATIGAMPPEHPLLDMGNDAGHQLREITAQTLFDATQPLVVGGLLVEGDAFRNRFREGMNLINVRTFAPPTTLEEVRELAAGVTKSIVEARQTGTKHT